MDRRTDEYCLSAPLILVPEFLCNVIVPPGPWTFNCIKLCQGGGGVPPLCLCVWKMTQMDTNYMSLRRFPLIALLASPNASKPALLHSLLTVTGRMLLNFLLRFQIHSTLIISLCMEPGFAFTDLDRASVCGCVCVFGGSLTGRIESISVTISPDTF